MTLTEFVVRLKRPVRAKKRVFTAKDVGRIAIYALDDGATIFDICSELRQRGVICQDSDRRRRRAAIAAAEQLDLSANLSLTSAIASGGIFFYLQQIAKLRREYPVDQVLKELKDVNSGRKLLRLANLTRTFAIPTLTVVTPVAAFASLLIAVITALISAEELLREFEPTATDKEI